MIEIIGLLGHQGVGKNYISEKILPTILSKKNYVVLAFADHFKIDCISKHNVDYNKVFGEKDFETRRLLQLCGTEEGRNKYGFDIWVKTMHNWVKVLSSRGVERFIISDVRFENEIEWIKSLGGIIIKIEATERYKQRLINETNGDEEKMKEIMNHYSEINIDIIKNYDILIHNDFNNNINNELKEKLMKFI